METKICTKCGIPKLIEEFYKYKNKSLSRCKQCLLEYHQINKDRINKRIKQWKKKNPKKIKNYDKKYKENHKKELKKRGRKYYKINKIKLSKHYYTESYRKKRNKYLREKLKNDPIFKLNKNISKAIRISLKGNKNCRHWENLVGYTFEDLKEHLEEQFKDGMTWNNYGKWHLDHRIPVSLFNITGIKSKGFKKAWELENLQPLWAKENLSKSNKLFI